MTFATKITVARMALIPVFVGLSLAHGMTIQQQQPETFLRAWAVGIFIFAACTDWLDGYIARVYDQRSQLGSVLDPLADKLLNLAGIVALSFGGWEPALPKWFAGLALLRDVVILWFAVTIQRRNGHLEVIPLWTGKLATTLQMVSIGWVMLRFDLLTGIPIYVPAMLAGIFVTISGFTYYFYGMRQLRYPLPMKKL